MNQKNLNEVELWAYRKLGTGMYGYYKRKIIATNSLFRFFSLTLVSHVAVNLKT